MNKTKLHLYMAFIIPTMLCGSECWAINNVDMQRIDAVDQWCLRRILDIRWHDSVRNADIRCTTNQPPLSSIIKSRRLTFFGHLAGADENADASQAIFKPPPKLDHQGSCAQPVCLSVPWRSCLGYRHAGCLQLSHRQPPDMCDLWELNCHQRRACRLAEPGVITCYHQYRYNNEHSPCLLLSLQCRQLQARWTVAASTMNPPQTPGTRPVSAHGCRFSLDAGLTDGHLSITSLND